MSIGRCVPGLLDGWGGGFWLWWLGYGWDMGVEPLGFLYFSHDWID